jgi:hypothetical protein
MPCPGQTFGFMECRPGVASPGIKPADEALVAVIPQVRQGDASRPGERTVGARGSIALNQSNSDPAARTHSRLRPLTECNSWFIFCERRHRRGLFQWLSHETLHPRGTSSRGGVDVLLGRYGDDTFLGVGPEVSPEKIIDKDGQLGLWNSCGLRSFERYGLTIVPRPAAGSRPGDGTCSSWRWTGIRGPRAPSTRNASCGKNWTGLASIFWSGICVLT